MNDEYAKLVMSFDGIMADDKIDVIELLIRDITDRIDYDDICGSTFMIDMDDLTRTELNHLITIGRNFNSHLHTQIAKDGMTTLNPIS